MGARRAAGLVLVLTMSVPWLAGAFILADDPGLADSPWPMHRGDSRHTGYAPVDTGDNEGGLAWTVTLDGKSGGHLAIGADGTIYLEGRRDGSTGLFAVSPEGESEWFSTIGVGALDLTVSAIASNGTLFLGSSDGNLYAIDPEGAKRWAFATDGPVRSSPLLGSDGTIYVGSDDGSLYAVNPNGTQRWRHPTPGPVRSSPALDHQGRVVFCSEGGLITLNADGSFAWSYPLTQKAGCASPAIDGEGTVYVCHPNGYLFAIETNGSLRWKYELGSDDMIRTPAIGRDGTIYTGAKDGLYAIEPDGSGKWKLRTSAPTSSPTVSGDGTVFFASEFYLWEVFPDGEVGWSYPVRSNIVSEVVIGPDGTIYIVDDGSNNDGDSILHAVNGKPKYDWVLLIAILVTVVVAFSLAWVFYTRGSKAEIPEEGEALTEEADQPPPE